MGCCVSSSKNCNEAQAPVATKDQHLQDRALVPESDTTDVKQNTGKAFHPPPPVEEETVKEVLSETAKPKPAFRISEEPKPPKLRSFPKIEEEEEEEKKKKNAQFVKPFEEISEDSELYSLSESVSTSAVTEWRDDGEVTQRVVESSTPSKIPRKRSVSGEFSGSGERGGKSPAKRSPAWRNDSSGKSFHGREVGKTARRRILPQNGPSRRDSGESSSTRSRSPATRMDSGANRPGGCQSPSSRRSPQSPARNPVAAPESRRMVEEAKDENWLTKESLEDPLVSLECFIFL